MDEVLNNGEQQEWDDQLNEQQHIEESPIQTLIMPLIEQQPIEESLNQPLIMPLIEQQQQQQQQPQQVAIVQVQEKKQKIQFDNTTIKQKGPKIFIIDDQLSDEDNHHIQQVDDQNPKQNQNPIQKKKINITQIQQKNNLPKPSPISNPFLQDLYEDDLEAIRANLPLRPEVLAWYFKTLNHAVYKMRFRKTSPIRMIIFNPIWVHEYLESNAPKETNLNFLLQQYDQLGDEYDTILFPYISKESVYLYIQHDQSSVIQIIHTGSRITDSHTKIISFLHQQIKNFTPRSPKIIQVVNDVQKLFQICNSVKKLINFHTTEANCGTFKDHLLALLQEKTNKVFY